MTGGLTVKGFFYDLQDFGFALELLSELSIHIWFPVPTSTTAAIVVSRRCFISLQLLISSISVALIKKGNLMIAL